MSEVTGISRTSIQRILKHYKWHPYKIQLLHELNEDDHDRRLQFCEIILRLSTVDHRLYTIDYTLQTKTIDTTNYGNRLQTIDYSLWTIV
nr:unnamed protein product [Callosobruchus chinensis]